jgi:hypothetical protein
MGGDLRECGPVTILWRSCGPSCVVNTFVGGDGEASRMRTSKRRGSRRALEREPVIAVPRERSGVMSERLPPPTPKRGAFPTPKPEIEKATPYVPDSGDKDDPEEKPDPPADTGSEKED